MLDIASSACLSEVLVRIHSVENVWREARSCKMFAKIER